MKQVKVSNPKLQKLLDSIHGWKEVALVAFAWAIVIALAFAAHKMP